MLGATTGADQEIDTATWVNPAPHSPAELLHESTSEALLLELQGMIEAQRGTRHAMLASFLGGTVLYMAGCMAAVFSLIRADTFSIPAFIAAILASLSFLALGMAGLLRIGRGFFKRQRARLHAIIPALAERGEPRLLPHLLKVMDMRHSGILLWQESRPVFLTALETLLSRVTPEQFQELSRQQTWDALTLLNFPDGRLRETMVETLIRCGDYRTVEALKRFRSLSALSVTNPKSLFIRLNPMMNYLLKQGVPFPSLEMMDASDRALKGLQATVDEMKRTAQLLRASAPDSEQKARELLRASAPSGVTLPPKDLLRPAPEGEANADRPAS